MFLNAMGGGASIFYILKSNTNPKRDASTLGFWYDDNGTDKHFQGNFGCSGLSCDPYAYIFNAIKVSYTAAKPTAQSFFLFGTVNSNDSETSMWPVAVELEM